MGGIFDPEPIPDKLWPSIDADGAQPAAARTILRDKNKPLHFASTGRWKENVDGLLIFHGLIELPTSEELFSRMNNDFIAAGATPQRGSDGRWSGRLYLPCPVPEGLADAAFRFENMNPHEQHNVKVEESHPDHKYYWWDFQRFVDMTPHPWGSGTWIWRVGSDPGVPK